MLLQYIHIFVVVAVVGMKFEIQCTYTALYVSLCLHVKQEKKN